MTDNVVKLPFQKPPGIFHSLWIPLLALLSLLLIDIVLVPEAFTLPLLLLLVLGYMAVRLPPSVVFAWGLVYAGVIFAILVLKLPEGHTDPALRPYLRAGTLFVSGVVIALLAGYRARLEKSYHALLGVVTSLPVPVLVSDISGNILLLNHEAEKLLHDQVTDLAGLSYFSIFTNPGDQEHAAMPNYISYFDRNNFGPFSTTLQTRGDSPKLLDASISIFRSFKQLYAVTVIERASELQTVQNETRASQAAESGSLNT